MFEPTDEEHFYQKLDEASRELGCWLGARLRAELLEPFRQAWITECAKGDGVIGPSEAVVLTQVLAQQCGLVLPLGEEPLPKWMIAHLRCERDQ